jgi:hypothetical protein
MNREAGQVVQPHVLVARKLLTTQSCITKEIHTIKKCGHSLGTIENPGIAPGFTFVSRPIRLSRVHRHAELKIWWARGREGSIPYSGTTTPGEAAVDTWGYVGI